MSAKTITLVALVFSLASSFAYAQNIDAEKPLAQDQSRPAMPIDQAQWARQIIESYPTAALAYQMEGTVGVRLTIGTDGRVRNCRVSRSSGHGTLDVGACQAIVRYARFTPALNDAGEAVEGSWSTNIVYAIN